MICMEREKMVSFTFSILIAAGVVLILAVLLWINAYQIYRHICIHHHPAGVKPWMWVNVAVGLVSLVAVLAICFFHRLQLPYVAVWWIGGILIANIALRIVEEFLFFGGNKGGWVG